MSPDLTVAICTLNRRADLVRTLASLSGQVTDRLWETLVVDNGSVDDTPEVVSGLADGFPVRLRLELQERVGLSHARNLALARARGRVILFIDDDVTCSAGWLEAHARAFDASDVLATGGRILPDFPPGTPDWLRTGLSSEMGGPTSRYEFGDHEREITGSDGIALPYGANMGIRLQPARRLGGFNTHLGWGPESLLGEETEFFERLSREPGRILYVPAAWVTHHIRESRVTLEYYDTYHRSFGRTEVFRNPPDNALDRVRQVVRQLLLVARYTPRVWRPPSKVPLRVRQKRSLAIGRLQQLARR